MGFVIGQIRSVKRHIKFDLPTDDGKKALKADLVVEFKVHTRDVLKTRQKEVQQYVRDINAQLKKARENADYELQIPDKDLDSSYLMDDIINIEGVKDISGADLPFSDSILDAVLADQGAYQAILNAWVELNTIDGAKRKN